MSVELSPPGQLGFPRPLTRLITRHITIHNPHPHPIAFKVKTTAPKQYCVRPNAGRVESGEKVEVQVLLQPLATEPPPHAKCKDKFLVQSAFITPDKEMRSLSDMWAQIEAADKSAVQEQKIKCVYLAPEDGRAENGIAEEEEGMESRLVEDSAKPITPRPRDHSKWDEKSEPKFDTTLFHQGGVGQWERDRSVYTPQSPPAIFAAAQSSPAAKLNGTTDRTPPGSAGLPSTAPANVPQAKTSHSPDIGTSTSQEKTRLPDLTADMLGASTSTARGGPTGVSPTNAALEQSLSATTSDSDKLRIALAEIDRLQSQLTEAQGATTTGLRRRGGGSISAEVASAGSVKEGAEVMVERTKEVVSAGGVPLEVVLGLLVATFVMTYLFF